MALIPYFVFSPNTILSLLGLIHGADRTIPTPMEDWKTATVDVVIPALNEAHTIPLCLASIAKQTMQPQRIILVDDGSNDKTIEYAKTFCQLNGLELVPIQRKKPIGKTPTLKRQAREYDSDVLFVLDGDTILESDNYIARAVEELYKGAGIASACGTILPIRRKDREKLIASEPVKKFLEVTPDAELTNRKGLFHRTAQWITNLYRDSLYMFLQRFVYHGQMVFFGSIINPVGCAVAYKRKYLKAFFDGYEPKYGDDLTNSEDIFIGIAMLYEGYRNIQLMDVYARSQEPEAQRLPHQVYLWSSSFLQSCYYFDALIRPFKSIKRYFHNRRIEKQFGKEIEEKRKIKEAYRQPFGVEFTKKFGRPAEWMLFMSAFEKITFPVALLIMLLLQLWEPLLITIVAETILSTLILTMVATGHRLEYFFKSLVVTPMRYASLFSDLFTLSWFAADLWVFKNRRWRK